ncbi:hypothetical protein CU098_008531 [Rhizopus stolonifer]|uniref:Uncharacterized protein n=1 Tax=Rhizopus stolonifer TaxID=4846 RepID=A0A367J1T6_RHIST|nr:hypothetical protein CU098_008531 [Rhizopus stolonifer]
MESTVYKELSLLQVEALVPSLVAMLLCVALAASNHPHGIPVIMNHYLSQLDSLEQKIQWIEYTRNGIFKSIVLCGGPRVINAEIIMYDSLPAEYKPLLRTFALSQNASELDTRGMNFFHQVYGTNSQDKQQLIETSSSDVWYFVKYVYSSIVSDMTWLNPVETELEVIVSLIQMDTLQQLQDHRLGAKRVGATEEQIKAAEYIGYQVKQKVHSLK